MGVVRAAVLEEQPFLASRGFEDEIVRMIVAYLEAVSRTNLFAAKVFAERLREKVAGTTIIIAGQPVSTTISIGLAAMNVDDASADHALLRAEQALTQAHQAGGNRTAQA
eukprot:gene13534-biopygen11883